MHFSISSLMVFVVGRETQQIFFSLRATRIMSWVSVCMYIPTKKKVGVSTICAQIDAHLWVSHICVWIVKWLLCFCLHTVLCVVHLIYSRIAIRGKSENQSHIIAVNEWKRWRETYILKKKKKDNIEPSKYVRAYVCEQWSCVSVCVN